MYGRSGVRAAFCYRKIDDKWVVTREHSSVPRLFCTLRS